MKKVIKGQPNLLVKDSLTKRKLFTFNNDGVFITDNEYILMRCKGKFDIEDYNKDKRHRSSKKIVKQPENNIVKWTLDEVMAKPVAHQRLWLEDKGHKLCEYTMVKTITDGMQKKSIKQRIKKRPAEMTKEEVMIFLKTLVKEG